LVIRFFFEINNPEFSSIKNASSTCLPKILFESIKPSFFFQIGTFLKSELDNTEKSLLKVKDGSSSPLLNNFGILRAIEANLSFFEQTKAAII